MTPSFRIGDRVQCLAREELIITGLHDARIPWPAGNQSPKARPRSIVLYADLAQAVRTESEVAVAHWFGVGLFTDWKWRKALRVGATNQGTSRLRSDYALEPLQTAAREKAVQKSGDPSGLEKIATAKRGKPGPAHVREALLKANVGRKQSAEPPRG